MCRPFEQKMRGSAPTCRSTPRSRTCESGTRSEQLPPGSNRDQGGSAKTSYRSGNRYKEAVVDTPPTTDHPEYGLAFQVRPESPPPHPTHTAGRDPAHGRLRQILSQAPHHHHKSGNGLAGIGREDDSVGYSSSRNTEVSAPPSLKERSRFGREVYIHYTFVKTCQPHIQHCIVSLVSCTLFFRACTHSARDTWNQRFRNHRLHSSVAPSWSSVVTLVCLCCFGGYAQFAKNV